MTTVFFDLETGGVEMHHPNISLAAVAMCDGKELEAMHCLIQFDEALAVPEALATKRFSDFLSRHKSLTLTSARTGRPYQVARLAGYNSASFDGPRANAMFDRHGMFPPFRRPTLDVLQLVLQHLDSNGVTLPNNKLSTVAAHFDIATDNAHDALADCRMTAAIHAKVTAQ